MRISRLFFLAGVALAAVLVAHAQRAEEPDSMSARPISLQLPSVAPVPGAPVRATFLIKVQWQHESGSTETRYGSTQVARDSAGRTWKQLHELTPAPSSETDLPSGIVIVDPRTHIRKMLDPVRRTEVEQRFKSPVGRPPASSGVKEDDLGHRTIDGFEARGTRRTWILPGQITDAGVPAEVFDETWFSPELEMIVLERRTDLLGATVEITAAKIDRGEPRASLFKVPRGYGQPVRQGSMTTGSSTWSIASPDQDGNITGAW